MEERADQAIKDYLNIKYTYLESLTNEENKLKQMFKENKPIINGCCDTWCL